MTISYPCYPSRYEYYDYIWDCDFFLDTGAYSGSGSIFIFECIEYMQDDGHFSRDDIESLRSSREGEEAMLSYYSMPYTRNLLGKPYSWRMEAYRQLCSARSI